MCAVISTNDGKQYKTPGFWLQAGAVMVGSMASSMLNQRIQNPVSMGCLRSMKNLCKNNDTVFIKDAAEMALKISGVKGKGVELIDVNSSGSNFMSKFGFKFPPFGEPLADTVSEAADPKIMIKNYKLKKAILTEMPAKFRKTPLGKYCYTMLENIFESGNNAGFFAKSNKIVVNMEKLGLSVFHEIGHSINKNMSPFWHAMQKMRTPALLTAATVSIIGLFKRKKVEGEEPKNILDKSTTFIKEHCGKLAALAFVPIVGEELMATKRGNKLAKQLLDPALAEKVVKCNKFGAITYGLAAVMTGVSAFTAKTVRDALSKPKEIKKA